MIQECVCIPGSCIFVCVCVCVCSGSNPRCSWCDLPRKLCSRLSMETCFETISRLICLYVCKFSMYIPLFFAKAIDVQVCYEFVDLYKECHYIV